MIPFDEPLSSLDAHLRERLRIEFADLTREAGSIVLYVTHDQTEVFNLAELIGVLNGGRLVQVAGPRRFTPNPAAATRACMVAWSTWPFVDAVMNT